MASYIPQISDNIQETRPQGGGYQFLQQLQPLMDKANQQYEVGKQDVLSGYSSIVNAQVAGPMAEERKRKYVQDAQTKLKTLSKQDLSLPQNVAQAEAAYAPFWEDTDLLENIGAVKTYSKTRSTLESWASSNDADTRAQYSDQSMMDAQRYLEQISMAPLDRNAYRKIEAPKAVRNPHLTAELTKLFESEYGKGVDKGISTIQTNGLAMTTLYNGPQSLDGYRTYAMSKLGDEYNDWFKQKARVTVWEQGREIKALNPTISDQELNTQVAEKRLGVLREQNLKIAKSNSSVAKYFEMLEKNLQEQIQKNPQNVSETQVIALQTYRQNKEIYIQNAIEHQRIADTEYSPKINDSINSKYQTNLLGMSTNPQDYLAGLYRIEEAEQWAIGKASVTQMKRETDPVEKDRRDFEDKDRAYKLNVWKAELDAKKANDEMIRANMQYAIQMGQNPDGSEIPNRQAAWAWRNAEAADILGLSGNDRTVVERGANSGITGRNITEVAKIPNMFDQINDNIKKTGDEAEYMTIDVSYTGGQPSYGAMVLGQYGMKLSADEMRDFSDGMKNMLQGGGQTPQQKEVYKKVAGILKKELGLAYSTDTPYAMSNAIRTYADKRVAPQYETLAADNDDRTNDFLRLSMLSSEIQQKLILSRGAKNKLDKELENSVINDPALSNLVITDNTGKKRLKTVADIKDTVPSIEIETPEGIKKFTNEELADLTLRGKVEVREPESLGSHTSGLFESDWDIKIDGTGYKVKKISAPKNATITNLTFSGIKKERPADIEFQEYGFLNLGARNNRAEIANALKSYMDNSAIGNPTIVAEKKKELGQKVAQGLKVSPDGLVTKSMTYGFTPDPEKGGSKQTAMFASGYAMEIASPENSSDFYYYEPGSSKRIPIKDASTIQAIRNTLRSSERATEFDNITHEVNSELAPVTKLVVKDNGKKEGDPLKDLRGKEVFLSHTPNAQGKYINNLPRPILNQNWEQLYSGDPIRSTPIQDRTGFTYTVTPRNKDPEGVAQAVDVEISYLAYEKGQFINKPIMTTIPLAGENKLMADEVKAFITKINREHINNTIAKKKKEANRLN